MPQASLTLVDSDPSSDQPDTVRLLEHDPDLAQGLVPEEAEAATRELVAPALWLRRGPWYPPPRRPPGSLGLLVLDGMLLRDVRVAGRRHAALVGPGDVFDPWASAEVTITGDHAYLVERPVLAAVLDRGFIDAARRWPELFEALMERMAQRLEQVNALAAIVQLPRVELRLLAVLWHAAQRWGRVRSDGILVPVPLTHEALGRLVGARRPTVTIALAELEAAKAIVRRSDRTVVVAPDSWRRLADGPCPIGCAAEPLRRGARARGPAGG